MPTLTQNHLTKKAVNHICTIAESVPPKISKMFHSQQVVVDFNNGRYWVTVMGDGEDHEYIGAVSLEVDQELNPLPNSKWKWKSN
jgi:hypothetical protein